MSLEIQLKRRWSGTGDAPGSLKSGEPAYNGVNDILYIGKGDDGFGNATSAIAIGGLGAFLALVGDQVVNGVKEFSLSPVVPTPAAGDNSTKAASTAYVDRAISASTIPDGNKGDITVSGTGTTFTINGNAVTLAKLAQVATATFLGRVSAGTGNVETLSAAQVKTALALTKADVGLSNVDNTSDINKPISTATQNALNAKAPLSSPAFTGTPTAPTAATGTNTTQLATTAFVQATIAALIDSAPTALDTLNELAEALGNDPNFATTITNNLAGKLDKSANLSDLTDVVVARANLQLGTMATQNASNVNITGGNISGVVIDGGTY